MAVFFYFYRKFVFIRLDCLDVVYVRIPPLVQRKVNIQIHQGFHSLGVFVFHSHLDYCPNWKCLLPLTGPATTVIYNAIGFSPTAPKPRENWFFESEFWHENETYRTQKISKESPPSPSAVCMLVRMLQQRRTVSCIYTRHFPRHKNRSPTRPSPWTSKQRRADASIICAGWMQLLHCI